MLSLSQRKQNESFVNLVLRFSYVRSCGHIIRGQVISDVEVKDERVTGEYNSGQPGKSPFPPSPKGINEERRDDKELHVHRNVPCRVHTLSSIIENNSMTPL